MYGRANTHQITLLDGNGAEITPSSDAPSIYLFSSQPTLSIAAAGTGAVQGPITSWSGSGATRTFTIAAVTDSQPTSTTRFKDYWLGVNFKLTSGGSTTTLIEEIYFERAVTQNPALVLKAADAKEIYPAIASYLSDAQINNYLIGALDDLKTDLEAKGIEWITVQNTNRFKRAAIFRAIADASLGQMQNQNDKFQERYKLYSAKYDAQMSAIQAVVDEDLDGAPEAIVKAKPNYYITYR